MIELVFLSQLNICTNKHPRVRERERERKVTSYLSFLLESAGGKKDAVANKTGFLSSFFSFFKEYKEPFSLCHSRCE